MIISQPRQRLKGGSITLPDWLLAPLYLHRGAEFWMAHKVAVASARDTIYEVIISSIARQHWRHLWKLKLTTLDRPGIAEQLCAVLEDFGVQILTAECSVHSRNRYNSMSFVVSVGNYHCKYGLDGGPPEHERRRVHRIPYLELSILAAMGQDLVFHVNGRPRLEFAPMRVYGHLAEDLSPAVEGRVDSFWKGKLPLSKDIQKEVKDYCGRSGRIFYAGAVDTENRLIRVLFFPEGNEGVAYTQMGATEFGTKEIRKALSYLAAPKANVLRFQVRRGVNKRWRLPPPLGPRPHAVGPGTIDLTFESTTTDQNAGSLIQTVRAAAAEDGDVHVTASRQ